MDGVRDDLRDYVLEAFGGAGGAAPDRQADTTPPLSAYRTFQIPIADIARTADLATAEPADADVLQLAGAARANVQRSTSDWIEYSDHIILS